MALPPQFFDELRARLPLSDVVGKRMRLIRAGREFKAPCPFHHEKTPSFYVNDQKGFFHCFGCGAHGDIIGFVMRHDNLSFPEAVEQLAAEAGMPVPRASEEERRKYERQKTLYDLVEHAARWFEQQLHGPAGRMALDYLQGRGLDTETMARFRLGYAPSDSGPLRQRLQQAGFSEDDMVTAGILRRPEDGRSPYPFFRHRVIFPVTDRRGRVVAFGGRILEGDGPKYVNSSDTPLFHKGSLLYGLSRARQAAADGKPVIVAEGYMDVIALVRAGFEGAVAPLGTALTETQIQELWKLIPDGEKAPFLCFDGDNAGRRAAWRAVERILPHLAPGQTARVAFLPQGEDPDSLIRTGGPPAMRDVLEQAIPLVEALWRMEWEGRVLDTPEAKAGLEAALDAHVERIDDRRVQGFYRSEIRRRINEAFAWKRPGHDGRPPPRFGAFGGRGAMPPKRHTVGLPGFRTGPKAEEVKGRIARLAGRPSHEKHERLLLVTLINHPDLFDDVGETLATRAFPTAELEELRQAIIATLGERTADETGSESGLDAASLCRHLSSAGFETLLGKVLGKETYVHGGFARADASLPDARRGWWLTWGHLHRRQIMAELKEAEKVLGLDGSVANLARVEALRREALTSGLGDADVTDIDDGVVV